MISVLSWNIWGGKYLPEVISFLEKSNADIVALQEVRQKPDGKGNIARTIAEKLGYEWVFQPTGQWEQDGKMMDWGNAVLSKYKIKDSRRYDLSELEKRTALEADIQVENHLLHVFSLHLIHSHQMPSEIQNLQADSLFDIVPKEKSIIMGDFNALPESYSIQKAREFFIPTNTHSIPTWSMYREGCSECKPNGLNWILDYIFTSKDITSHSFHVGESKGSDHLPIGLEVML